MEAKLPEGPLAPREGRWIVRPIRTPWYFKMGASAAILGQTPNWLRMILEPFVGKERSWIVVIGVFAILTLAFGVTALRYHSRRRREEAALLDAGFGDQFAVGLTIVSGGNYLGVDTGVLWFADGLMGFSGRASSFVLAPADVRLFHKNIAYRNRVVVPEGGLHLVGAPGHAYLSVTPRRSDRSRFRARFKQFESEEADPAAERFWPPLAPYEPAPTDAKALA